MRKYKALATAAFAGMCAAGVAASSIGGSASRPARQTTLERARSGPTAAEVRQYESASARLRAENVYMGAVAANQAQAWYAAAYWNDIERLAENYRSPVVVAVKPPVVPAPRSGSSVATSPVGPPTSGNRPSGGATGVCGGATNGADAFIQRESSGNPNAVNPSGATGCYQIMPRTWAGSCSDLGSQSGASTSTQAACASRLPRSSWSASGPTG